MTHRVEHTCRSVSQHTHAKVVDHTLMGVPIPMFCIISVRHCPAPPLHPSLSLSSGSHGHGSIHTPGFLSQNNFLFVSVYPTGHGTVDMGRDPSRSLPGRFTFIVEHNTSPPHTSWRLPEIQLTQRCIISLSLLNPYM